MGSINRYKIFNWKLALVLIILMSVVLRVWQLDTRPSGLSNDEANYIFTAYSIWNTGKDINGKILPVSFTVDTSFSPVNVYLMAPAVGILGPSVFSGRITNAILGTLSIFLIFLLIDMLFSNKKAALIGSFVVALSPWHILISRSAFDPIPTLVFFLLAIIIFIRNVKKGNILWSLPLFFFAFYGYHATKVFFIFFIPILLFVYRDSLKNRKKELLIFLVGLTLTISSFLVVSKIYGEKRQDVLFWNQPNYVKQASKRVDFERQKTEAPLLIADIFSNKPLFFLREMGQNYVSAFSPEILFFVGDRNRVTGYSAFYLPLFHPPELILFILGLFYLVKYRNKNSKYFVLLALLVAPLPGTFVNPGDRSFIFRGVMMIPFFAITIAMGLSSVIEFIFRYPKHIRGLFFSLLFILYSFFIFRSFYIYYFQLSSYGGEYWYKNSRDLAKFVNDNNNRDKKIYIATDDIILPIQFAIFNKIDPVTIRNNWNKTGNYSINNIKFMSSCPHNPNQFINDDSILVTPYYCIVRSKPTLRITDPIEPLQSIWNIYEKN